MLELDTLQEIPLEDTDWHDMKKLFCESKELLSNNIRITVKSVGGTPISVYLTEEEIPNIDDQYFKDNEIDPIEVGGLTYEISTRTVTENLYAKSIDGTGVISVRIYGTADPTSDLASLAMFLNTLQADQLQHRADKNNPHFVTKAQVGLSNIPNSVSNRLDLDDPNTLATSAAVFDLNNDLQEHKQNTENPHKVTKAQVGLSAVANYPPATDEEAIDTHCNDRYMTPHATSVMIDELVILAYTLTPQTVNNGLISTRPSGWSNIDMTPRSNLITAVNTNTVRINESLQVVFADDHKARLSKVLETSQQMKFGSNNIENGIHYVYCDLDRKGYFVDFGHTIHCPLEGCGKEATNGDYFDISNCIMMNSSYQPIRRVYIGKVWFDNGVIINVLSVPIGPSSTIPITTPPVLGGNVIVSNPYICPVDTVAQVKMQETLWSKTEWNDQIGVIASPRIQDPINSIVVQAGLMGYVTGARSAGNAFGSDFQTVTVAPKMNVIVTKKNR